MLVLQLLFSGLQTGAIYALTAAGFALIFGTTKVFHVAHGATYVLAGYAFYETMQFGAGWAVSCLAALVVAVAFGLLMNALVYRPIQRHEGSFFTVFVAAFGVSIAVQSLVQFFFGRSSVSISSPLTRAAEIMPGLFLAPVFWVSISCTAVLFVLMTLLLEKTNAGLGLRALSESPGLLRTFGLDAPRISMLAFALGSALVVPGAVLGALTTGLQPAASARVMLISLAAAVVGGIGSLKGAALAGLLLGITESLVVSVFDTQWSEAAGFVVLFAFIIFRPSGLFGKQVVR